MIVIKNGLDSGASNTREPGYPREGQNLLSKNSVSNQSISGFLPAGQEASGPQSSEPVFILTSTKLQEIITKAVQEATERLYLEIAYDRQRISKLEQREPQPLQKDRGEILRALLAANGGKMLAKEARQKMRMSKQSFTNLLTVLPDIESKPLYSDKRRKVLSLK